MKIVWKNEIPSLLLLAAMLGLAAASWSTAPGQLPVHWDLSGQPNRFGGKFEGLFTVPLLAAGIYALLLLLPLIDPRRANYAMFLKPFLAVRTVLVAFFFAFDLLVLAWIHNRPVNVRTLGPAAAGILMLVLGNYLPKIQSNWFVGVRTPWTLSSDVAWRRTHRLAGWLFVAGGLLSVLVAAVVPSAAPRVLMTTIVTTAVVSVVYSYFAWRCDPARLA